MTKTDKHQGFQTMDPKKQKKIAGAGGRKAHALRKAHEWSIEEARAAGRKGGIELARRRREARAAAPTPAEPVP